MILRLFSAPLSSSFVIVRRAVDAAIVGPFCFDLCSYLEEEFWHEFNVLLRRPRIRDTFILL